MSCDFYNERKIKHTRKEHKCMGCLKKFPKGHSLYYGSGIFDGDFFAGYLCGPCNRELYNGDYRDGYSDGELRIGRLERVRDWQHKRIRKVMG